MGIFIEIFSNITTVTINTVHHQAVKALGKGLIVQTKSIDDGIINLYGWKIVKVTINAI